FVIIVYVAGILGTLGELSRNPDYRGSFRPFVYSLVWPLWWACARGLAAMMDAISEIAWGNDNRSSISFGLGIFTAGYFLVTHWNSCDSTVRCLGVAMQTAGVAIVPVGAIYWAWMLAKLI